VATSCRFEPHSHGAYTVTSLISGRLVATIRGDNVELTAGDAAFTGVGETHSGMAIDAEFISVGISPELVTELAASMGLVRGGADISFRRRFAEDSVITAISSLIAKEAGGGQVGEDAMIGALAQQMAVHLLRFHLTVRKSARIELSRAGPVDCRLRRAIEFIHDNYSRELPVEEIAENAFLSEYHFSRLFKQVTGATPHAYLASVRLERARSMLVETLLPISEIAATVGYQSQSHFTRVFKGVTGLTPRAYRDANDENRAIER
jgi:AraC family transcriptional regulator